MVSQQVTTGFLYDDRYLDHKTGYLHPECPERLSSTITYLKQLPLFSNLKLFKPREPDIDWILGIHSWDYVKRVQDTCNQAKVNDKQLYLNTPDVPVCNKSFEVAKLATGGGIALADNVMLGNIQRGFALLRPPGHHAESDMAMGFCLFNNVAILAKYLQKKHNVEKVLILDFDVHHGNGTQHIFYEEPSVFYISLHQYPFYPGTGSENETGEGKGKNTTLNCPMQAGSGDKDYKAAFLKKILPAVRIFKPDIILISAGFDAHKEDPLANICLSTDCFRWMSERIVELANEFSNGRIISLLEGGYNLKALPECVAVHLDVLVAKNAQSQ